MRADALSNSIQKAAKIPNEHQVLEDHAAYRVVLKTCAFGSHWSSTLFPGIAGYREGRHDSISRYSQQHKVVEERAQGPRPSLRLSPAVGLMSRHSLALDAGVRASNSPPGFGENLGRMSGFQE